MNNTLVIVFTAVIAVVLAQVLFTYARRSYAAYLARRREAALNTSDLTKLMGGVLKACESIAQSAVDFREEVERFSKLVGGGQPGQTAGYPATYPEDNITAPASPEEADRVARTFAAILRGVPVDEAEQEAREHEEKKTALSAVSFGPET